jgi:AraC-like DNA-binding protein/mannose-6-phosphate isomerase-like protein (cupin superfamily)
MAGGGPNQSRGLGQASGPTIGPSRKHPRNLARASDKKATRSECDSECPSNLRPGSLARLPSSQGRQSMHSLKLARRELVPADPNLPLTLRDARASHFTYPWHYHPEIELTLIVAGRGLRYVGDSIHAFEDGDLCLIGTDTPHCWLSKPVAGEPVRALVIQFLPKAFGTDFWRLSAAKPIVNLLYEAGRGLRVRGALLTRVTEEVKQLFAQPYRPVEQLARLLSILAMMADSPECEALSLTRGQPPDSPTHAVMAQRVLSHIHENASRSLTQREVADLAGLSAAGFSRFFSRHFGKPFVSYLAEIRVGNACRLLMQRELGIAQIAAEAGFNNLANFNRRFRDLKGVTPSEYRRMAHVQWQPRASAG